MPQITNTQLLAEITRIKDRLENVEHAVDGKTGGTIATLIRQANEMNHRLQSVEKTLGAARMFLITIGSIVGPIVSLIGLIMQYYRH